MIPPLFQSHMFPELHKLFQCVDSAGEPPDSFMKHVQHGYGNLMNAVQKMGKLRTSTGYEY